MAEYRNLLNPEAPGVVVLPNFVGSAALAGISSELADRSRVEWSDSHGVYQNGRKNTIVQNHDTFALKLSRGEQHTIQRLPYIRNTIGVITAHVGQMAEETPTLVSWVPDEVSIHRYDRKLGLSAHKDNLRFFGLIAILNVEGTADLVVDHAGTLLTYTPSPGDLVLLRAPGLIDTTEDLRPEHAVMNVDDNTRTSLMVRANSRPDEQIPGFVFANWPD